MSVKFVAASSTRLSWAPGTTFRPVYPWTVGFWCRPALTGTLRTMWFFGNPAAVDEWVRINQTAANLWGIGWGPGGAEVNETWGTVVAGEWTHILCRFISATNRRYSALKLNGGFEQGAFSASLAVEVTITTETLGCKDLATDIDFFDGDLAEFFYCTDDIGILATANVDRSLHAKIAFEGPLSYPPMVYKLREYWSFRAGFRQLSPPDVKFLTQHVHIWTPSATPPDAVGPNPPLMMRDERSRRALLGKAPAAPPVDLGDDGLSVIRLRQRQMSW
ncbi:MAG: hypothetical protein ACRDGM_19330 [bacterium]